MGTTVSRDQFSQDHFQPNQHANSKKNNYETHILSYSKIYV